MSSVIDAVWLESFDAFIFDCDGTLVDSMDVHFDAWTKVFEEYKIDLPLSFLNPYNSIPSYKIGDDIVAKLGLGCTGQEIADRKESLLFETEHRASELTPISSIARKYYGKMPMAVISGGVRKNVIKSLKDTDLLNLFEHVLTADDLYGTKDQPDIWLEVAGRLKCDPVKCLVFEDGEKGMEGALRAKMTVFDVRPVLNNTSNF